MSRILGIFGEKQAEKYLKKIGYKILDKNFHSPFGEIDIIALDGKTLVFIEVKKRNNNSFATGAEYVDLKKQKKIISTAMIYIQKNQNECDMRFDVVEINSDKLTHIKNAFFCN